ncbi:MAG: hypothetical protein KF833_05780 [Verrucomicrobiae bacterium]|nr:hypothetical protein [Verrucomicrobiae bacterium]
MKKFITLAPVTVGVTMSARAQWVVYDPWSLAISRALAPRNLRRRP